MHLVKNSNCVKKLYSTQYGHVRIIPDCLGSAKKVTRYMCYNYLFQLFVFQLFISKRAPMGKRPTSIRLILAHGE